MLRSNQKDFQVPALFKSSHTEDDFSELGTHTFDPPFFKDIQEFHGLREFYRERFPDFAKILDRIDAHYGVKRAEFIRLEDLIIGFLSCAETGNFHRWNIIRKLRWNYLVLSHLDFAPGEFTLCIQNTAESISPKPLEIKFSQSIGSSRLIDLFLLEPERNIEIPVNTFARQLFPRAIDYILAQDLWKDHAAHFRYGKDILSSHEFSQKYLKDLSNIFKNLGEEDRILFESDELLSPQGISFYTFKIKNLLEGIEEIVNLAGNISSLQFRKVYDVLADGKKDKVGGRVIGRLSDPDFEFLQVLYKNISLTTLAINHAHNSALSKTQKEQLGGLVTLFKMHAKKRPEFAFSDDDINLIKEATRQGISGLLS